MAAKLPEGVIKEDFHGGDISSLLDQMQKVNLNTDDEDYFNDQTIPAWLTEFESPFLWHGQQKTALSSQHIIERCVEKMDELSLDDTEFQFRRYTVLLKLVLEYSNLENKEKVDETMKTIADLIKIKSTEKDPDYERSKLILAHVVSATEAHLLALDGQEEKSKEIAHSIMPIHQMANHDHAGLCAMKANFFLYSGYEDAENTAVEFAKKAQQLEPDNHRWLFLLSKVLRQQRKQIPFFSDVPREELRLLEKAVEQCKSSKYLEYLAQVYRECATQAHKKYRNEPHYYTSSLHSTVQDMHSKALNYYKEALEINPDNPANLRRIGYGIMNLPKQIADYDLALKCLLKSLEKCKSVSTQHIIGTFYHRYRKDNIKALEYFEKTVNTGSHAGLSDMIRVKYMMDPEYNPCEDIENGLKWDMKKKNRMFLLTQQGGYYLFMKRDLIKSMEYFNQVIDGDKDTEHMTVFKSIFLRMFKTINLYHYLANEALLYLRQHNSSTEGEDDAEIYEVMALLDTISTIDPTLAELDPDPFLVDELCKSSQEIISKENVRKDRPRQNGPRDNFHRGHQGGFRPRRGGSFERGASGKDKERSGFFVENQGHRDQGNDGSSDQERSGSFSGYRRGRGQNVKNLSGQRAADEDNWRRK